MKNAMRKRSKKLLILSFVLSVLFVRPVTSFAYTADTKILPTTVSAPSDGCILVGVKGSYVADSDKALKRINEIRLEACTEGVPDPRDPSRKLTKADYTPMKWSAILEKEARLRAAEASLVASHTRPNGESCFSLPMTEIFTSGECLAWNFSSSMVPGVNQWYGEKSDWVNQNPGRVTGHYTAMINPWNTYVGLGCMLNDEGVYYNTLCGRFTADTQVKDTAKGGALADCIQLVEIERSALGQAQLVPVSAKNTGELKVGSSVSYELMISTRLEGDSARVLAMDDVKWTSSDKSVAVVDSYGKVTGVGAGAAVITARSQSGASASVDLTFKAGKQEVTPVKAPSVPKVKSLSVKAGKKKLAVTWKKVSKASGYEVQISTKKGFKGAKTVKISKSTVKYTAKSLKARQKYYVRVRAYKNYRDAGGKLQKAYGPWVTTKKKTL